MTDWLSIINFGTVGLFGTFLSASFCKITWTKRTKRIFEVGVVVLLLLQAATLFNLGAVSLRNAYPLLTHLPLTLLLWYLSRKAVWSLIAVLTAYLCCQLRRWIPLLLVALFQGGDTMQVWAEIIVTVPLLYLVIRFASPAVRGVSEYPVPMQIQFGLGPFVGYVFDYLTRIYTDWLITGAPVATEFMLFVCAVAQLVFARHSNDVLRREREYEQRQLVLDLQVRQSARQIENMVRSQEMAAEYRHDLRHHLQYLSACVENGEVEQAQAYMKDLDEQITRQAVGRYCENTAVNLILSSFAGQAAELGVSMSAQVRLGSVPRITDTDLCVLLSNALENALHACAAQKSAGKEPFLEVRGYQKNDRVFLEIVNSCGEDVMFEKGLPVTRKPGHGIGVRSICTITEKYGGLYAFEAGDGRFVLRLSL